MIWECYLPDSQRLRKWCSSFPLSSCGLSVLDFGRVWWPVGAPGGDNFPVIIFSWLLDVWMVWTWWPRSSGVQGSQTHCCDADPFPFNFIVCLTLPCFSCMSKAKFGACFLKKWCGCVCRISPNQTKNCINLSVRCFWTHPWELFHLSLP